MCISKEAARQAKKSKTLAAARHAWVRDSWHTWALPRMYMKHCMKRPCLLLSSAYLQQATQHSALGHTSTTVLYGSVAAHRVHWLSVHVLCIKTI